jgi:hypothetical protein
MEATRATAILTALANGVDPATGEEFPAGSACQSPDVVRALMCAVRALESAGDTRRPRSDLPGNAGKPWTPDEDRRLLEEHESGRSLAEMAAGHARTVAGIEARLEKLGRLDPEARTTPRRYPVRSRDEGATRRA